MNTVEMGRRDRTPQGVVGKVGFIGPLIRPTGTLSPRGEEGIETPRHIPSLLWWRQPDEGLS
ncbi:hypothetical protein GFL51_32280 [Rhizobium leguminosarum bv. viciae]|nr:hypothetical protein [Rhizobium leguminosarum bv. viciae]